MKESNKKLLQISLMVGGVLILFVAIILVAFQGSGGETQVVLHNIGECPNVMMIVRQADGSDTFTLEVGPGETDRADVKPNITYVYEIRFPAEPDAADRLCKTEGINEVTEDNTQFVFDRGQFVLPAGSTQEFNIASSREEATDEAE